MSLYSKKTKEKSEETVPYLYYVNDTLELDKSHDYYYQVQEQLFWSGRKKCTFNVYTLKDIKNSHLLRDEHFIENMLKKLKEFFESHFRKAVLNRVFFPTNGLKTENALLLNSWYTCTNS